METFFEDRKMNMHYGLKRSEEGFWKGDFAEVFAV